MSKFVLNLIPICFLLFSSVVYAAQETIFLTDKPSPPDFKIRKVLPTDYNPATKASFLRSFYNQGIDEETSLIKRYKNPMIHVSLEDCLAIALEKNFNIKIATAKEDQWKWAFKYQTGRFFPDAFYSYSLSNLNGAFLAGGVIPTRVNETPVTDNFWLKWTVFDGGYRIFQRRAVKNLYDSSKQDLVYTREDVLRNVATSYYRLLSYKLGVRVLLRNVEEIEAQLEINKKNGVEFDVLRAQASLAEARQRLTRKYSECRTEQVTLANILGIDVEDCVLPAEESIVQKTLIERNLDIETLYQTAYQFRPDLESLRLKVKSLENEKKSYYSGFVPQADAFASMGRVGTARLGLVPSRAVGLIATVPFGHNFGISEYTTLNRYDSLIDEARYNLENRSRDVHQNILTTYYAINSSNQRSLDAEEQVVAADKALEQAFVRLENRGLYIDVWQTQLSKADAKINLITAVADYNIAQVNQLFNTGAISVYNLTENIRPDPLREEMDVRLEK